MLVSHTTTIPFSEQEKFSKYLMCYPNGALIIQEGHDDNAIYLLREGTVAVDRGSASQIATIEAVNIFGEMAMILKTRRTATIRVISPQAIVYKFQTFDLQAIYNNPAWSELLITRLCNNLSELDQRVEAVSRDRQRISDQVGNLVDQSSALTSALAAMQAEVSEGLTDTRQSWKQLHQMQELRLSPRRSRENR
jgi:CRP-like cAMP-binding protein